MKTFSEISLIIPVLNERENLQGLLETLAGMYPGISIFISDDGSTDGTLEYIKKILGSFKAGLCYIERESGVILTNMEDLDIERFNTDPLGIRKTPGLTASVIDALQLVRTPEFAVMDADFQHPPELPGMINLALKKADIAAACRKNLKEMPPLRRLLTKLGTAAARAALPSRIRVRDPLTGAFGGKTAAVREITSDPRSFIPEGFKVFFDILRNLPSSVKISEVDYEFSGRKEGSSKIRWVHMLSFWKGIRLTRAGRLLTGTAFMLLVIAAGNLMVITLGDLNISRTVRIFGYENPGIRNIFRLISKYGYYLYHIPFALMLAGGAILRRKNILKLGLAYLAVQTAGALIITPGMQYVIGRPRPRTGLYEFAPFTERTRLRSFPSGHATTAFASAGLIWVYPGVGKLAAAAFIFSSLIALSRIFLEAHYFLDVLTGVPAGFGPALIITYLFYRDTPYKKKRKNHGLKKD